MKAWHAKETQKNAAGLNGSAAKNDSDEADNN